VLTASACRRDCSDWASAVLVAACAAFV
jgi:hypothetical protein